MKCDIEYYDEECESLGITHWSAEILPIGTDVFFEAEGIDMSAVITSYQFYPDKTSNELTMVAIVSRREANAYFDRCKLRG